MFRTQQRGVAAYAKVGTETGVFDASPHRLILMLFDGALAALANARLQMRAGDVAGKGASISKAIAIIDDGLKASLDVSVGGETAANLYSLYEYMSHQLLLANLRNNPAMLEEVRGLLAELRAAWETIGNIPATAGTEVPA
ncbi:MAG: flagellar export chaperone FliS [Betaproteobacteria bacterium]|nr:flagellar export chaperone FliS [Betaproteobacteria bacterium]